MHSSARLHKLYVYLHIFEFLQRLLSAPPSPGTRRDLKYAHIKISNIMFSNNCIIWKGILSIFWNKCYNSTIMCCSYAHWFLSKNLFHWIRLHSEQTGSGSAKKHFWSEALFNVQHWPNFYRFLFSAFILFNYHLENLYNLLLGNHGKLQKHKNGRVKIKIIITACLSNTYC